MFKLKKIIGAKNSVPEVRLWDQDSTLYYKAGCVYLLDQDCIAMGDIAAFPNMIKIMSTATIDTENYPYPVPGFIITRDMVFEADVAPGTNPSVGSTVKVVADEDCMLGRVEPDENGVAVVIGKRDTDKNTVDVMFI